MRHEKTMVRVMLAISAALVTLMVLGAEAQTVNKVVTLYWIALTVKLSLDAYA